MNAMAVYHAAVSNVILAVPLGLVGLGFVFPGIGVPVLRWLTMTERGRSVALALVVGWLLWWQWDARFSRGFAAGVASEHSKLQAAQVKAAFAALDTYMDNAAALAAIGDRYEQQRIADMEAARSRTVADIRSGKLRLREPWRCVSDPATASGERDGCAERRIEAAGRIVGIGAGADAQLAACQAVVRQYLEIAGRPVTP